MRCVECFFENPAGAQWCKSCGTTILNDKGPASAEIPAIEAPAPRGGFFSFGTMISPMLIQAAYATGAAIITLTGLLMAGMYFTGTGLWYLDISRDGLLFGGLLLLGLGNILWRVFCEMFLVLFRIHEALLGLDHKTRSLISLLAARK